MSLVMLALHNNTVNPLSTDENNDTVEAAAISEHTATTAETIVVGVAAAILLAAKNIAEDMITSLNMLKTIIDISELRRHYQCVLIKRKLSTSIVSLMEYNISSKRSGGIR
ncbi:unnamed protein product [Ceratitis capitata]|uniref:(Mediterranean fruit fly) hypothetical protein n=1 Tax=Ceratitis capitata TaxID=7213 RepID=A0A811UY71_CERCA|nr:unnamed protein product [Ceratitis capitata]